ncbi:Anaphase-promoting complex subunit 6 [Platanthera guangdongensis]|uniref:Anaphase-promoting complex subunit 6 n=1 Tax=Platanthera guangdongensis TaxID=2320717 RepID=A0ABR2MYE0_9ASPA
MMEPLVSNMGDGWYELLKVQESSQLNPTQVLMYHGHTGGLDDGAQLISSNKTITGPTVRRKSTINIEFNPPKGRGTKLRVETACSTWFSESSLLSSLQFGKEDAWLSSFYSCLVKKHDKENVVEAKLRDIEKDTSCTTSSPFMLALKTNADVLACNAEYYYQCGEYLKCFELTSLLLAKDPFHLKCILVHLAAAMELGHSNDLYLMACNLIKDHPQNRGLRANLVAERRKILQFAVGVVLADASGRAYRSGSSGDSGERSFWRGQPDARCLGRNNDLHFMTAGLNESEALRLGRNDDLRFTKAGGAEQEKICLGHRRSFRSATTDVNRRKGAIFPRTSEPRSPLRPAVFLLLPGVPPGRFSAEGAASTGSPKATSVDATFPPAWIGSGNAYAVQEETDQAMLAYRTAARLFPGLLEGIAKLGLILMFSQSFHGAEAMESSSPIPSAMSLELPFPQRFLNSPELLSNASISVPIRAMVKLSGFSFFVLPYTMSRREVSTVLKLRRQNCMKAGSRSQ